MFIIVRNAAIKEQKDNPGEENFNVIELTDSKHTETKRRSRVAWNRLTAN